MTSTTGEHADCKVHAIISGNADDNRTAALFEANGKFWIGFPVTSSSLEVLRFFPGWIQLIDEVCTADQLS
jgi:hypothetical protein